MAPGALHTPQVGTPCLAGPATHGCLHLLHCEQEVGGATHRRGVLTVNIAVPVWEGLLQVTHKACAHAGGAAEPVGSFDNGSTHVEEATLYGDTYVDIDEWFRTEASRH